MPERATDRRQPGRAPGAPSLPRRSSNPVLARRRALGNRAVAQMLAREPVRTGTVNIPGVGTIQVKGGNLEEWDGTESFFTVDVTSKKGKHSAKLEKLVNARTRTNVKVTITPPHKAGEEMNLSAGTVLEIEDARIKRYAVQEDGVETWVVGDFERVARKKEVHRAK